MRPAVLFLSLFICLLPTFAAAGPEPSAGAIHAARRLAGAWTPLQEANPVR